MLTGVAAGSRRLAAAAAVAGLALAASGCGSSSGGTLHTTHGHHAGRQSAHATQKATARSSNRSKSKRASTSDQPLTAIFPQTKPGSQIEQVRKATERQVTQVLQASGATSTQISCITRQMDAMSDLRFQTVVGSQAKARATLRAMEARCAG